MNKARYIMIGGFLGAGKTTAVLALARHIRAAGKRPGLITNDQSFGLVDTAMLSSNGFDVEEIGGGCFCCRFNTLVEASENLSRDNRPDAFVAEPVGSCTDLRAAVSYPLRRIYGDNFEVAPLSVLIDPVRAERMLGLEPGRAFAPKVHYVYDKQLEEADAIVINKADLLDDARLQRLQAALTERYPHAAQYVISARTGRGLDTWFQYILSEGTGLQAAPEVDYEIYAEGEALLGWLNATIRLSGMDFDGNAFLHALAAKIQSAMISGEIAHLKMTLSPDQGNDIAVLNLVRNDTVAEQSHSLQAPLEAGELILNLRAEEAPEILWQLTQDALQAAASEFAVQAVVEQQEHFRPGKPDPTHRMAMA